MSMGKIMAVCISEKRGTPKINVASAELKADYGIAGDAHAGKWHRQVSLLSYEKAEEFKNHGADISAGSFGENLLISGMDFSLLSVGDKLVCENVCLEITQIGKQCHNECEIFKKMGRCIMPTNGVFARVITGGTIKCGDSIQITGKQS